MPNAAPIRKPRPANNRFNFKTAPRAVSPTVHAAWRQRIATTKIIDRLQAFALDDPDNPTGPRLTRTQAMVALSMLRKVMPDMQSLEVSGNSDQPITVQILRFADAEPANAGIQNGHGSHAAQPAEPLTIDLQPDAFEAKIEASPRLIEDEPATPVLPKRRGQRKTQAGSGT